MAQIALDRERELKLAAWLAAHKESILQIKPGKAALAIQAGTELGFTVADWEINGIAAILKIDWDEAQKPAGERLDLCEHEIRGLRVIVAELSRLAGLKPDIEEGGDTQ